MFDKVSLKLPPTTWIEEAAPERRGEIRRIGLTIRTLYILLAFLACAGTSLSFLSYRLISEWEAKRISADFQTEAANRIAAINNIISNDLKTIYALGAFYKASQIVDRHEFHEFADTLLHHSSSIQALAWIPRVPGSARASQEDAARKEGFADFQIREINRQGLMVPAGRRQEYFPAYFIEHLDANRRQDAFGFDLGSDPIRLQTLNLARTTGQMTATPRITLVKEGEEKNQFGFLIFLPVYKKNVLLNSLDGRHKNLEGFLLGVFRLRDILDEALSYLQTQGITLSIYDMDDSLPPGQKFLCSFPASQPPEPDAAIPQAEWAEEGLHLAAIIPVANRKWRIACTPEPQFIKTRETWQTWGVPIFIFFFSVAILGYFWLVLDRMERTKAHATALNSAKEELEREIDERKKAELEKQKLETHLRQVQKMEAIGTLAGGIAHDFNNILASIIGFAELARYDIPEATRPRANIDEVLKASSRARELVKQILTFSRKTEIEKKPVFPHLIIKEDLKLLRASIPATIEIRQDIDPECGAVLADPSQIDQVIVNLCTNASHAMGESGGVMEIQLKRITISDTDTADKTAVSPGSYIRLTVSDTGHGMEPAVLERIFEPYFTTKEPGKGSGLGLAVVHGIIQSLDGAITVDSDPHQGTAFHVYLPSVEAELVQEIGKAASPTPGKERLLVVDDEITIIEFLKTALERFGYRVTATTSSIEALKTFQKDPNAFDLIITDQTIPSLTGTEFAQKALGIRADIPIILCTGYSTAISEEKALKLGIRAFIMKPLSVEELTSTVRRVLDRKKSS